MALHIAIDGPAGAGKSTIAKAVAQKLSIPYLDTGAMYRTLALFALKNSVSPQDGPGVEAILPQADISVFYQDGVQHMLLNGEDVTGSIRTPEVSKGASDIGVHPPVREKLVELQQQVAKQGDVVMDGRDICTVVMPHAEYKFFVTATAHERAIRRHKEMLARGETPPSIDQLEQDILARDHTDSTRVCNPLKRTEDAQLIDTSDLTIEQSVQRVLDAIRRQG